MNVTELARRLRVTPNELLDKLPGLGFDIGRRAIKVDNVMAEKIMRKWVDNVRRERLRNSLLVSGGQPKTEADGPVELKVVTIPEVISVRDFAGKLNLPITKVIQHLMRAGILAAQNERLDYETAAIVAEELGFKAKPEEKDDKVIIEKMAASNRVQEILDCEKEVDREPRPPVIVVMGHVDHGKTKTLDAIRTTNVTDKESGGITQHIGAYQVTKRDRNITFIDTPGHEAFTVMRSRGARVADIAILVVAADDGVQPQTVEAIEIIQAAKLPFVVALNKMDKPEADPDRALAGLAEKGVTTEAWGGQIPVIKISAKQGQGIDELLDTVLLVADMNADKIVANPNRLAAGTVIESHVDKGEGPVATVLIQTGTLKRNDYIGIAGAAYGRVRAMREWNGKAVDEALPGTPVKIIGFKVAPAVGDILEVPEDPKSLKVKKAKTAYQITENLSATKVVSTKDDSEPKKQTLNVVLRCDVLGSLEALLGMLEKIHHEDVGVEVIQKGLGNITDTDITRAENSSPAVVYGFNVVTTPKAAELARDKNVEVKECKVIYDLLDDVVAKLNEMVPPEVITTPLGNMEVVAIFRTESDRMVIGGKVIDGKIKPNEKARVWRGEDPVGIGEIETVQCGKQGVKEAYSGQECGLSFKGKTKILIGDRLDIYHEEIKERKVEIKL
ncbi:MAG: translation initiation factor IF-2 [Patescibacteria group bacterium]